LLLSLCCMLCRRCPRCPWCSLSCHVWVCTFCNIRSYFLKVLHTPKLETVIPTFHNVLLAALSPPSQRQRKRNFKRNQDLVGCPLMNIFPVECVQYTGQNPRQHVVLVEIQPNAYNKYLSQMAGVILTFFGVIYFCVFGICQYWSPIFLSWGGGTKVIILNYRLFLRKQMASFLDDKSTLWHQFKSSIMAGFLVVV
jgi:hypothetical protein